MEMILAYMFTFTLGNRMITFATKNVDVIITLKLPNSMFVAVAITSACNFSVNIWVVTGIIFQCGISP